MTGWVGDCLLVIYCQTVSWKCNRSEIETLPLGVVWSEADLHQVVKVEGQGQGATRSDVKNLGPHISGNIDM